MPNGFGRGRGGGFSLRGGMGFGFRGASPPWPYFGIGRGGLPRCGYFLSGAGAAPAWPYQPSYSGVPYMSGYAPAASQMAPDAELGFLRNQAAAIRGQIEQIETRIKALGGETEV
jgi:hypothetical protein